MQACSATVYGEVHHSLISLLKGHQGEHKDSAPALRLQASSESLELVRNTNPLLTQSLGQLLFALRVFSFG